MKFQINLFIFAILFAVTIADTLLRSQPLKDDSTQNEIKGDRKYSKEEINHFREMIEAHRKKISQKKQQMYIFDENEPTRPDETEKKNIDKRDTLLKSFPVQKKDKKITIFFKNGQEQPDEKHVAKRDTLLKALPVKHREDKKAAYISFKDTLLKSGEAVDREVKHRDDRAKAIITFKDTLLRSGEAKQIAKRDTLLRSLSTRDKRVAKRDTLLRSLADKRAKRDTLLKSLPTADKRAPQHDALLNALRERYNHQKDIAKRDTLLKSHTFNKESLLDQNKSVLAARRREAIRNFLKNRNNQKSVAQRDTLLRSGEYPGSSRKKRDIAATVVGAAVSSVVSNLMKNVEESVVKAENEAKKLQSDVLDSDQGLILGQGEIAPVSSDVAQKKPAVPLANEAVPFPFHPMKAFDTPKTNDLVPRPLAPIHADVEVVVGNNNTSTTTAAPSAGKKGFFSTLFSSFKLFFGTVTNSVGGFFIDVGSRITNFVEKRIKV